MDQHGQASLAQPEGLRAGRIEDALDPLQLDEVVPCTERSELARPASVRTLGDHRRVGARQAAARLGAIEVLLATEPTGDQSARPVREHLVQLLARQPERPVLSRTRRDRPRELVNERLAPLPKLDFRQGQDEQANPAVDVVADAARRDDPVRQRRRRDPADREPVALVDVGHRERRLDHSRQRRDVRELLQRPVARDRVEQLGVGEDPRRNPHSRAGAGRDLPQRLVQPNELKRRERRAHATHLLPAADRDG